MADYAVEALAMWPLTDEVAEQPAGGGAGLAPDAGSSSPESPPAVPRAPGDRRPAVLRWWRLLEVPHG